MIKKVEYHKYSRNLEIKVRGSQGVFVCFIMTAIHDESVRVQNEILEQ